MKTIRKMFIFVFMMIGLISNFNLLDVNAKTAPSTITLKSKSSMYYFSESKGTDYISGYNFYRKELTDGTLAYCVSNISTSVPGGKTLSSVGAITDNGLDYIIKNGYPNKSITGDAKKDYYITQAAIWKYFDETRGSRNWGNTSFTSSSTGMKAEVYKLVQAAKVAKNSNTYEKPSITVNVSSNNLTLSSDGNYFVSQEVKVELKNTKGTYTVNLTSAPSGTLVRSTTGDEKTTFSNGESFVIYVPASSISNGSSGSVKLTVSAEGVTYKTYSYTTGNSRYQDVAPSEIYEEVTETISEEITFTYEKESTKVKISKQDITTKEELPGATLVVKDKDGNVVEEWVSTTTPHYIENLEPGDYTLIETIAPDGYILSTETIKFTVKDDGSVTSVVMYNTKDTTDTKVKISKQDIATKEELPGATLVVKDKDGNVVEEWVSTTTPHYIEGLEPGEYTLTETIAPDGYVLSTETIKFTVKDDGSVTSVVMYNTKDTTDTKVKISKQDIATKEELPGATLVVKDKDGNVVEEWVSTTTPHYIEGLEPGEYTLTETIAPDGYVLSTETIKFTVKDDGSVTSVVMYNTKYTEVPITDLNISSSTIIIASILIVLGTGLVVYYAKFSK